MTHARGMATMERAEADEMAERPAVSPETTEHPDVEHLLTLPQLAERLNLSPRSVQRRARAAGIKPATLQKGVSYYAADVAERLEATRGSSAVAVPEQALAPAMERLVAALQESHAAALAAERRRGDEAAMERDRLREALTTERDRLREELAVERAARLALLEDRAAAVSPVARPWWRFWGMKEEHA